MAGKFPVRIHNWNRFQLYEIAKLFTDRKIPKILHEIIVEIIKSQCYNDDKCMDAAGCLYKI